MYNAAFDAVLDHNAAVQAAYPAYTPFATMLYGSQNYNLATPTSDVDTKAIVLPSFGNFALRQKWLSEELTMPDNSLSIVKDIRGMFGNFLKSNINFLECLYTPYVVVNPAYATFHAELAAHRDFIANASPLRVLHAAAGMASQKYHALEKPFESKAAVLAKFGYDPKQLCHLARLRFFMQTYSHTLDFATSLIPTDDQREWIFILKAGTLPLERARAEANFIFNSINAMLTSPTITRFKEPQFGHYDEAKSFLDDFTLRLLRAHLVAELAAGAHL